jgi:hypothetical protein
MTTTRGSRYAGLLPVPLTTLENERLPNGQPSFRKRVLRGLPLLTAFCASVGATFVWWSYSDATGQIATPRDAATVQKAPNRIAPTASDSPDHRQLDAMRDDDLHAIRLGLDRIVASQELIARSIDEIATRVVAGQAQMMRNTDQTATSIAAEQEPTTRSANETAAAIATGQELTRSTDETAISIDHASATDATPITVGRAGGAALQPALRVDIKPSETGLAQTRSERGKQLAAASGYEASCFPSAAAVLHSQPGALPTWTLRAPGHEGTQCWRAAARTNGSDHRPSAGDHRSETMPKEAKTDGTTENELFAPPARYWMRPE